MRSPWFLKFPAAINLSWWLLAVFPCLHKNGKVNLIKKPKQQHLYFVQLAFSLSSCFFALQLSRSAFSDLTCSLLWVVFFPEQDHATTQNRYKIFFFIATSDIITVLPSACVIWHTYKFSFMCTFSTFKTVWHDYFPPCIFLPYADFFFRIHTHCMSVYYWKLQGSVAVLNLSPNYSLPFQSLPCRSWCGFSVSVS